MTDYPVLKCDNVVKNYAQGPSVVHVLRGINLSVMSGQRVAIVGESGSGKSTLLNVLGGLDRPTSGNVEVEGKAFSGLSENARGTLRNKTMGFVYQFHHLLPEFSAQENVAMPLFIAGIAKKQALATATDLLEEVGLNARLHHRPSELSGGERQRVAIARALANNPAVVLMDEPTGNLDRENATAVQQLMLRLSEHKATSFVVVTHDEHLAESMDLIYTLCDGVLSSSSKA